MARERLQKVLAAAGVASRRGAETLIAAGRVTVDGRVAAIGESADPAVETVAVDGRPLVAGPTVRTYLAMHKPAGVTATVRDRHAPETVLDLVPPDLVPDGARLYPVGRLDRDSEGLLLLTDDGAWADRLLHPRYGVEREYAVGLDRPLRAEQAEALRAGVALEEGVARLVDLRAATRTETQGLLAVLGAADGPDPGGLAWYRVTLGQGWKRQVRRMCGAVGAPVRRLVRVRVGTLRLGDLACGEVRPLSAREARRVAATAAAADPSSPRAIDARANATGARTAPTPRRRSVDGYPAPVGSAGEGLVVALDGPGSSGKSTVGAEAARRLRYRFCDTGLLYRAVTWLSLARGVAADDATGLVGLVDEVALVPDARGRLRHVQVDGVDVTHEVRSPAVDEAVSAVASVGPLRAALLERQRRIAAEGAIIMAGRDIGTVVLPDADLKLFLDASAEERARRRSAQRHLDPQGGEATRILDELRRRDALDSGRAVAPLRIAPDAVVIRTDGNRFEDTVRAVVAAVRRTESARDPRSHGVHA
ncbi:MAG TPA: (d)CMP kinase [Candidatus Limnocylindrales bacterium]